jgi:hypothetical protein
VRDDEVHRDVYIDQEVFDLEMERLWSNTWVYVGHTSQVPKAGDYYATDVAAQPVLLVALGRRIGHGADEPLRAQGRQAGRATPAATSASSSAALITRGRIRLDGAILGIPLRRAYENTRMAQSEAGRGMVVVDNVEVHRGFVFCRLAPERHRVSRTTSATRCPRCDNMADRSPEGATGGRRRRAALSARLQLEDVRREPERHACIRWWRTSRRRGPAKAMWADKPADMPKPMAIEQFVPFVPTTTSSSRTWACRVFDNGHGYSGVHFDPLQVLGRCPNTRPRCWPPMAPREPSAILGHQRGTTPSTDPNLTIKGAIQAIRVARPLAAGQDADRVLDLPAQGRAGHSCCSARVTVQRA